MKTSFTSLISFFFFFFTISSVLASPIAEPASNALVSKRDVELDGILTDLNTEVFAVNGKYTEICKDTCTTAHVTSYCGEVAKICYKYIDICKTKLPSGYKWKGLVTIIVDLVVKLLVEINITLKFLLGKCGLLGIVAGVVTLVAVLIGALNALLACLALYVEGLLALVAKLLIEVLGVVGCLLCTLGLILI